jgi:hypothetical protein
VPRTGLALGISAGLGNMVQWSGSDLVGMGGHMHIGKFITPRTMVMLRGDAVNHPYDNDDSLVQGAFGLGGRYWVHDRAWLDAGLGVGFWKLSQTSTTLTTTTHCDWLFGCSTHATTAEQVRVTTSEKAPAVTLGAGFDIADTGALLISMQAGTSLLFYSDGMAGNMLLVIGLDYLPERRR